MLDARRAFSNYCGRCHVEAGNVETLEVTTEHVLEVTEVTMSSADRIVVGERDRKIKVPVIIVSRGGCDNSVVSVEVILDVSRANADIDLGVIV